LYRARRSSLATWGPGSASAATNTERGDPQVAEEYLPIIHLVFASLKTWLNGTHHGGNHQHLQAYLNEFTFRVSRRFYPFNAFTARHSGRHYRTDLCRALLRCLESPYIFGGVGKNRIGKQQSSKASNSVVHRSCLQAAAMAAAWPRMRGNGLRRCFDDRTKGPRGQQAKDRSMEDAIFGPRKGGRTRPRAGLGRQAGLSKGLVAADCRLVQSGQAPSCCNREAPGAPLPHSRLRSMTYLTEANSSKCGFDTTKSSSECERVNFGFTC
jgi:hypothetical protein